MRGQPAIVLVLGGLIAAAYLFQWFAPPATQEALLFNFAIIPARFQPGPLAFQSPFEALWSVLGHVFLHGGLLHLGMNLLMYFQIGGALAQRLDERGGGTWRFLAFFFGAAAGGALAYVLIVPGSEVPAIGASGAISGLFAGYLLGARKNWRDALADPRIRSAAFWFLAINVVLVSFIRFPGGGRIAWEAHLGGFIAGATLFTLLAPRRRFFAGPWG